MTTNKPEVVAYATHHDEPMLFPSMKEAAAYCEDGEGPVALIRLSDYEALQSECENLRGRAAAPQQGRRAAVDGAIDKERFKRAPCYLCGYNGPGYYQPDTHPCAAKYHAANRKKKEIDHD